MQTLRWGSVWIAAMLVGAIGFSQDFTPATPVRVVRYDGLADAVLRNRGKVILVDFWGEFCPPCKAGFPHVVQLHRQYARNGLVVISVSVDDVRGNYNETTRRVNDFLRKQGATFTNLLLLDDPIGVAKEKIRLNSVPCCYVFNRHGKWTQFGGGEPIDYPAMDRFIVDLLRER